MNTRNQNKREAIMPPAIYEKCEQERAVFESKVSKPVTRQELSYNAWVYGNKLKSIQKEN